MKKEKSVLDRLSEAEAKPRRGASGYPTAAHERVEYVKEKMFNFIYGRRGADRFHIKEVDASDSVLIARLAGDGWVLRDSMGHDLTDTI